MKIIFLGTGAAEGIPGLRCRCERCCEARNRGGKFLRQNSGIYLEGDTGERLLIDCPSQIKQRLNEYGIDDSAVTDLLITHYHQDHTNGFYFLAGNTAGNGFVLESPINVFLNHTSRESLSKKFHSGDGFIFNTIADRDSFSAGSLRITALETGHLINSGDADRECFGYLIESEEKRIAYLADCSADIPATTMAVLAEKTLNCLILECTFLKNPSGNRHMDIAGVLAAREKIPADKMIITHISHRNLGHDELTERMMNSGIEVAWDGMTAEI